MSNRQRMALGLGLIIVGIPLIRFCVPANWQALAGFWLGVVYAIFRPFQK
jgi:hypothetical protein